MSEPIWISCPSLDDLPTDEQLVALATDQQHVVLELPNTAEIKAAKFEVIAALTSRLPDYSIFDSGELHRGGTCITVLKVMAESDILANADAIVAAARQFRATAHRLMTLLADHLGVPLSAFADPLFRMTEVPGTPQPEGVLGDGWHFMFHGFECGFRNSLTGQDVDVRLGFTGEFGALDPFFFARFLSTTPEMEPVRRLFKNDFHDPARALDVLEKHGLLTVVTADTEFGFALGGLVALENA